MLHLRRGPILGRRPQIEKIDSIATYSANDRLDPLSMATLVLLLTSTRAWLVARRIDLTKNHREQGAKMSIIAVQDIQYEFRVAIGTVFVLRARPIL